MLIGLSHTHTTGSILSICANLGRPWLLMYLSEATCRFRVRCRSSSTCFRMRRRALPILNAPDGTTGLSVIVAAHSVNLTVSPPVPAYSVVGSVVAIQASPLAPSWSAHIRRYRYGSGRPTWLPAKHPAFRLSSFSGNSESHAMKPRSRSFINCGPAWCVPTRIGLAASLENTSKPMKPMLVGVPVARVEAFTTWFSSLARSGLGSASTAVASISEGLDGTQGVFDLRWCQIAAPNH